MIKLARIDDRLIHGQVITSWIRQNNIEIIVIVDDNIAKDKVQLSILKMATPPGLKVYALTEQGYVERHKKGVLDNYSTMLIFADVKAVLNVINSGVEIKVLNLGGISKKPNRTNYTKTINLTDEERDILLEISDKGVMFDTRQVITDSQSDITKILKEKRS